MNEEIKELLKSILTLAVEVIFCFAIISMGYQFYTGELVLMYKGASLL